MNDAKAGSATYLTSGDDQVSTGFFLTFSPVIWNNFIAVQLIYFKIGTLQGKIFQVQEVRFFFKCFKIQF
ncbi:MAG: hypothetical protein GY820_20680 [Gammaproteobacteria bacterium]|nr:hypothetical protein [Gammaproteobacteria bacterium]